MSRPEGFSTFDQSEALDVIYGKFRFVSSFRTQLLSDSIAKDIQGNLIMDPDTSKAQKLDFVPIDKLSIEERQNRGNLWNLYFGPHGFSLDKPEKVIEQEQLALETAMALASYAHEDQKRGTGEAYVNHVLRSAIYYAEEHKAPIWRTIGNVLHDAIEDSGGKVHYQDIRRLFGSRVGGMCERLTKVRKLQKIVVGEGGEESIRSVKDIKATEFKLINALSTDTEDTEIGEFASPIVIAAKIGGDVVDNTLTLSGKTKGEQQNTATYVLDNWVPLARAFGLHYEAQLLSDACYKILDEAIYDDGFIKKIENGIKTYLETLDLNLVKNETFDSLQNLGLARELGVTNISVSIPGMYEIAEPNLKDRTVDSKSFFLKEQIALEDESMSRFDFESRKRLIVTHLINSEHYSLPDNSGLEGLFSSDHGQNGNSEKVNLTYSANGRDIPIQLKVMKKSQFDLESTPITYVEAEELMDKDKLSGEYTLEERKSIANKKLAEISEIFRQISEIPDLNQEEIFPRTVLTLHDSITVFRVENDQELLRAPLPPGSTVADYALLHIPGSWHTIRPAFKINGNVETKLNRVLEAEDVVEFEFGENEENYASVNWLDSLNSYQLDASVISQKIEERINQSSPEEKEAIIKEVRHRGWTILNDESGVQVDDFGLKWAEPAFPPDIKDARKFAYLVGLGKIKQIDVERAGDCLRDFWENLTVVNIQADGPNNPGIANAIDEIFTKYNLNIIKLESKNKWGDTARLPYRFRKKDDNYDKLNVALSQIEEKLGHKIRIFETNNEYQNWLTVYHTEE